MTECRIYNSEGHLLSSFDTDDFGRTITIGRSSKCSVSLKTVADTTVSREHLVLNKVGFKWTVTNQSRFGMFKDGVKYTTTEMNDGDIFRFTKLFLCFGPRAQPSPYDVTWAAETETGKHRAVLWPGVNTIGASNDNYVTIRTMDVSRVHAYIKVLPDRITYKNIHPDNPSYLNGEELDSSEMEVQVDDVITMGETPFRIVNGVRFQQRKSDGRAVARSKRRRKNAGRGGVIVMLVVVLLVLIIISLMIGMLVMVL